MTRTEEILAVIDVNKGAGLEIGPLAAPIVSKGQADIFYADHMSQDDLRKKYKNEPIELSKIVPVDYVLGTKTLKQVILNKKFNYVVASHVIEHIPNTVSWLADIAAVLEPGGILSLVIPDKRFTFDINRQVSTPADIIGAHLDNINSFTSAMMYDFAAECLPDVEVSIAWNEPNHYVGMSGRWTSEEVMDMCLRNKRGEYVDCHCYVFTPKSFADVLRTLMTESLLDFEVASFTETVRGQLEFFVSLRKINKKTAEVQEQLETLPKFKQGPRQHFVPGANESSSRKANRTESLISRRIADPLRDIIKMISQRIP